MAEEKKEHPTPKPDAKPATNAPAHKDAPAKKAPAKPAAKSAPHKDAPAKKAPAKSPAKKDDVKVVDQATPEAHKAVAKPQLSKELRERLRLRAAIDSRRPRFRRQQWYEYKRLENSGWRRPTGVDSAMRRHFGYEQSVVRVGFRGPVETRGLHPSGFEEVYVISVADLAKIDPKKQAARVSGNLGTRKLKIVYAEADKKGVRVLNRRNLE